MNRRTAIKTLSLALGGALVATGRASSPQPSPRAPRAAGRLSARDLAFLDEVGETILPTTPDSPGAKASQIGEYMRSIVESEYAEAERLAFLEGIDAIDAQSDAQFGGDFLAISPEQRLELLLGLERDPAADYYARMRELTVSGYFSSEVGATTAHAHLPIPGRWEPCIEATPETRPWS